MTISPARSVAVAVLHRVTDKGAYASLALDAEIKRARLDARDAALATEIAYGSLRVLPELDRLIAAQIAREGKKIDPWVNAALRASCYQLQHLSRIPTHAVVDDAVSLVSSMRGRSLGGFVNAILRKIAAQRPQSPQPPSALCLPAWLASLLLETLGPERFSSFVRARPLPPPLGLRVHVGQISRDQLAEKITKAVPKAEVALGELSQLALVLRGAGDPRKLPGYAAGDFSVQEEGAQLVVLSTGARPGERVVDACAGHGGKSRVLAQLVGPTGSVVALDIDERKLAAISQETARVDANHADAKIETSAIDLTIGRGGLEATFDRVLVDAPCSGLGTIHRRPELLLRIASADLARFTELQQSILISAAKLVRPSGRLIYSVCSPLRQEGVQVASLFEACCPNFKRVEPPSTQGLPVPDPDGITRVGPWLTPASASSNVDAYQIIQWIAA